MTDDLRTLTAEAITARLSEAWPKSIGVDQVYAEQIGHEAADAALAAVLPAHRRMVLDEVEEAIDNTTFDLTISSGPGLGGYFRPSTVDLALRRLAGTGPETAPESRQTGQEGEAVGRDTPEAHRGADGVIPLRECRLCHVTITTGTCTHTLVTDEQVVISRVHWERTVDQLNRLRTLEGQFEDGDCGHDLAAYAEQAEQVAKLRAEVERLGQERDEANARSFEIAGLAGDRLNEIEKLHRTNRAQALAIEVVGEKLDEVRAEALRIADERDLIRAAYEACEHVPTVEHEELRAERDRLAETVRQQQAVIDAAKALVAEAKTYAGTGVVVIGTLDRLADAVDALGPAAAVDAVGDGQGEEGSDG